MNCNGSFAGQRACHPLTAEAAFRLQLPRARGRAPAAVAPTQPPRAPSRTPVARGSGAARWGLPPLPRLPCRWLPEHTCGRLRSLQIRRACRLSRLGMTTATRKDVDQSTHIQSRWRLVVLPVTQPRTEVAQNDCALATTSNAPKSHAACHPPPLQRPITLDQAAPSTATRHAAFNLQAGCLRRAPARSAPLLIQHHHTPYTTAQALGNVPDPAVHAGQEMGSRHGGGESCQAGRGVLLRGHGTRWAGHC